MSSPVDQDRAYEEAVLAARSDPAYAEAVREAFLDADDAAALARFRESEHWARILRMLSSRGISPPARLIDFGGGRGLVTAALATEGFEVTLCEPNPSEVCGRGAATRLRGVAGLRYEVAADVSELVGAGFDAVVCRAVLHHVEPLVPVLRMVREALRPGGWLVCSDEPTIRDESELPSLRRSHPFVQFGVDENALTPAHYRSALAEAGFERVEISFPVAWEDYRRRLRPHGPVPLAYLLYWRYRLRSRLRPVAGEVRSIAARAPSA